MFFPLYLHQRYCKHQVSNICEYYSQIRNSKEFCPSTVDLFTTKNMLLYTFIKDDMFMKIIL